MGPPGRAPRACRCVLARRSSPSGCSICSRIGSRRSIAARSIPRPGGSSARPDCNMERWRSRRRPKRRPPTRRPRACSPRACCREAPTTSRAGPRSAICSNGWRSRARTCPTPRCRPSRRTTSRVWSDLPAPDDRAPPSWRLPAPTWAPWSWPRCHPRGAAPWTRLHPSASRSRAVERCPSTMPPAVRPGSNRACRTFSERARSRPSAVAGSR